MTFEQFQATRKPVDNLGKILADAYWEGKPNPGNLYLDALFIDEVMPWWPDASRSEGRWHLLLDRDEWISDDLESLERKLYEWALSEGYALP